MKYNHMYDVAFTIDTNKEADAVTADELIEALEKRLLQLKYERCAEAFGHCDTMEIEGEES